MLTRIYAISFPDRKSQRLSDVLRRSQKEEIYKILGAQLDLFSSEGRSSRNSVYSSKRIDHLESLVEFLRGAFQTGGYIEIKTPR